MIVLQTIAVAFAMFSAIPVPQFDWNEKNMRYAMCAFPLIGVVIGAAWCVCGALPLPGLAKAAGFALIPVWITGGIHLDGYADTCDALSSYGDRTKKLEILKDPHCGAFAVIRLCSYFLAYFALCTCVSFTPRVGVLWVLALVLGGAASGKSEYAESLVLRSTLPRYYLATMQVWDAECAARVEKHRRMRAAKQFETIECPLHLETVRLPRRGTALLEDLGNLTANELYDLAGAGDAAAAHILQGLDALAAQCENLVIVSNEVFSGGADYAGDTDRYLLALAQVNNALAARADAVVRVVCGIPVYYKGVEK